MVEIQDESEDTVKPAIEHHCEKIFADGQLEQVYNCLVYHFDFGDRYFWARSYLDKIDTVALFGPFDARDTKKRIRGVFDEAVLSYLKRRFREIQALEGDGYLVIWPA